VEKRASRIPPIAPRPAKSILSSRPWWPPLRRAPITEPSGNRWWKTYGGGNDRHCGDLALRIVYYALRAHGGNQMDEAITNYLKRKYNLLIR